MKDETVVLILFIILYNSRTIYFGTGFLICRLSLQSSYRFMDILTRIYVATL